MRIPKTKILTLLQNCAPASVVGTSYFLAVYLSLYLSQGLDGIATIWPASGIFVAALLLAKPGQSGPIVCAVGVASFATNMMFGAPPAIALSFTLANLIEGLIISQLVIRSYGVPRKLDDTDWLVTFFGATVVGSVTSALIAAALAGDTAPIFLASWFLTVCLGTLITAPLIVTIVNGSRGGHRQFPRHADLSLLALVVCVAAISSLVLYSEDNRFLFLPVIGVIAVTYFFGSRGSAFSIGLISIIAIFQTDFTGASTGIFGLHNDVLFLQFYLLSLLCAAWPLAALLAQKAILFDRYAQTNAFLKLAESTAKVGHWSLGSDNTSLVWSEEVYRIHGVDPNDLRMNDSVGLEDPASLGLYHPDDRGRVRAILLSAMQCHEGFSYEARIVRPDGSICHISSVGRPRYDGSGVFEGLFGTIQDITEQTETLEALRVARSNALGEAATARRLSETDDLTGIANRRKALIKLRSAARAAKRNKEPLAIAIFDIDHFKTVNDSCGHHTGDKVLKRVAKIVASELRPTDLVGRVGGEEFLVILPGEDGRNGFRIIERIRQRIAAESWTTVGLTRVTVSAGLATLNDNDDIEDCMQRADRALYQAKQDGRNLLRIAA